MKKVLVLLVVLFVTFSETTFAKSWSDDLDKIESLKKDKNFINFYNAQFNFVATLSKSKKLELFQKFTARTASKSEIAELAKALGYENEVGLNNFLSNQNSLIKNFSVNHTFLKNADGQKIISDALLESAKEGKFNNFSQKQIGDCVGWFMIFAASCYASYEACINDPRVRDCVGFMSICLTAAFNGYDSCRDLELN